MKVLMISTDRRAFEPESEVRKRFIKYGKLVEELHIVIFAKKHLKYKYEQISDNVFLYPTNSSIKFRYITDAVRIGNSVQDIDIVTTQDPFETGQVGVTLARQLGARLEIQVHTDFLDSNFKKGNLKNWYRVPLGKRTLARASCIRTVSERSKESIQSTLPTLEAHPIVLPIFVNVATLRKSEIKEKVKEVFSRFDFTILMLSRLEKEKNITRAIDVLKKVVVEHPKVGLVIVGDGGEREKLQRQVSNLGLEKNIVFEGWQDDRASYYKSANVFLSTSLYEGYGMSMLEALASGCPVLSTDVGVAREIGAELFTKDK